MQRETLCGQCEEETEAGERFLPLPNQSLPESEACRRYWREKQRTKASRREQPCGNARGRMASGAPVGFCRFKQNCLSTMLHLVSYLH